MDRPIQEQMWGMIKLKARDLIPFWPKGRSTESLARPSRFIWTLVGGLQKFNEDHLEEYRRGQEAMVDNFRKDQRAMDILRGKYPIDVVLNIARCFTEGSDEQVAQEFLPGL
jgi:hypothetical protein